MFDMLAHAMPNLNEVRFDRPRDDDWLSSSSSSFRYARGGYRPALQLLDGVGRESILRVAQRIAQEDERRAVSAVLAERRKRAAYEDVREDRDRGRDGQWTDSENTPYPL